MSGQTKEMILQHYGLTQADLLSSGMEAEVYRDDRERVVKLYQGGPSIVQLKTLQDFYHALDHSAVSFGLPQILSITRHGDFCATVECYLPGKIMSTVLPSLDDAEMDRMMGRYLDALLEFGNLTYPKNLDRYLLFDAAGVSAGDWNTFLLRYLELRLSNSKNYLEKDVTRLAEKLETIRRILSAPFAGSLGLVHGDYYPGNVLINEDQTVTGVIDFGMLTMLGDPLFDVATAWVFFDMYDDLQANLRERMLEVIIDRLGKAVCGRLYRYVLLYSLLSADTYSPTCEDGQYQWCVQNLNNDTYWAGIE